MRAPLFEEHDWEVGGRRRGASLLPVFVVAVLVGAVAWCAFALGVMPRWIALAHAGGHPGGAGGAGGGPAFLMSMMTDRANWPVEHYQLKWAKLAASLLAFGLAATLLPILVTSRWFERRIIGRATPGALGAVRALVCLIAVHQAWHDGTLRAVSLVAEARPRVPMGVMQYAYALGLERVIASPELLVAFKAATMAALLLAAVGLYTRATLIAGTVMYVLLMGVIRSYYWFNHTGVVPMYVLGVLCLMRCGDGFSLDRLLRVWRQQPVPDKDVATAYYAWCRWTAWAAVCVAYALAGFSKLGNTGGMWWDGTNLMAIVYRNALRPIAQSGDYIIALSWVPLWVFTLIGVATIVTEIGMLACLFSRVVRVVLPLGAIAMHVGILYTMTIPFYDLMMIQLIFLDWRWIRRAIGRGVAASKGRWTLLYDGRCPLCRRTIAVIGGLDLFERIRPVDFRRLDFAAFNAGRETPLTPEMVDRQMYLVADGTDRAYGGFDAYRRMALFVPLLWPAAPLLWLPGVSHAGRAIYARVARGRPGDLPCDDRCGWAATPPAVPAAAGIVPTTTTAPVWPRRGYRGLVRFVAVAPALLVAMWTNRVEFYPLSCFQMFTTGDEAFDKSGRIVYYRIYALDAAGNFAEAYPERLGYHHFRYWADVSGAFKFDPVRDRVSAWLQRVGDRWNEHIAPPDAPRIVRFELHEREWDFVRGRTDPQRGKVRQRIQIDVPSGANATASLAGSGDELPADAAAAARGAGN